MQQPKRGKRLIVLNDGTWCGRETGTESNISMLAKMMGIPVGSDDQVFRSDDVVAGYSDGIGLGGTFLDYLFDGATASKIGEECTNVYKFIVKHYTPDHEIWLFGLSRGAYTVRCVAGMINNCGILKRRGPDDKFDKATEILCDEVYRMYRSPYVADKPGSEAMLKFRVQASWDVKVPVKFMGLFDTVGAAGIPKLNSGVGFEWPEFYDHNVSSEVEKVYHACSLHDRLWIFQPCRALRDPDKFPNSKLGINEMWFPGCHYDLGRQKFKFFRDGVNIVEKVLFEIPNKLTKPIEPNHVFADIVLLWMLKGIRQEDPAGKVIQNLASEIRQIEVRMSSGPWRTGSGDVYSKLLEHSPAGLINNTIGWLANTAVEVADKLTPNAKLGTAIQDVLGVKTILNILLAVRDRRIPAADADAYPYKMNDSLVTRWNGQTSIAKAGDADRYLSKTYEAFQLYLLAIGDIDTAEYDQRVGNAAATTRFSL